MAYQPVIDDNILVFTVNDRFFALPLGHVYRTDLAAELTPLAGSPDVVKGLINFSGMLIPVLDMRVRIGAPKRRMRTSDRLIFSETHTRRLGLLVDDIIGIKKNVGRPAEERKSVIAGLTHRFEACRLDDGKIILIHDAEALLDESEDAQLQRVLEMP